MKFYSYRVFFEDGTSWPRPGGDEGWQARYGTPQPLVLASYVDAFDALVIMPERRRREVIRALRLARRKRDGNGDVIDDTQKPTK